MRWFDNVKNVLIALVVTLVVSGFFFAPAAHAYDVIVEECYTYGGDLFCQEFTEIPNRGTVIAAIGHSDTRETGTIERILITNGRGSDFLCENVPYEPNIDFIEACGQGPASLDEGEHFIEIIGHDFGPLYNTLIQVALVVD